MGAEGIQHRIQGTPLRDTGVQDENGGCLLSQPDNLGMAGQEVQGLAADGCVQAQTRMFRHQDVGDISLKGRIEIYEQHCGVCVREL